MNTYPGTMLVFEAGEGAGKSTQEALLADTLTVAGHDVVLTREPGGTPLAEDIRGLLLSNRDEAVTDETELLMMFAARSQHLENVICPALEDGKILICSRFEMSTRSYQGAGRGMNMKLIEQLEDAVLQDFRPDMTILLDIDPAVGMARAAARGELDRIESAQSDFFERVRGEYLRLAEQNSHRVAVVDADREIPAIAQDVLAIATATLDAKLDNRQELKSAASSSPLGM